MTTYSWPATFLPKSAGFWIGNQDTSGGIAATGSEQVISSVAQRIMFQCEISLYSDAGIREANAFFAAMSGRANSVLVPDFFPRLVNWPMDAYGRTITPEVGRELAGYTKGVEGTVYDGPAIPSAAQVTAVANAGAVIGATQIAINISQGAAVEAGQAFGIGQRRYHITEIVSTVGSVVTVKFLPRLRAALSGGASIIFTNPLCLMRQANADQCMKMVRLGRYADLTLEFTEDY